MAAGGGKPLWGVDIDVPIDLLVGRWCGLLVEDMEGRDDPIEPTTGEKQDVDGGVGGV